MLIFSRGSERLCLCWQTDPNYVTKTRLRPEVPPRGDVDAGLRDVSQSPEQGQTATNGQEDDVGVSERFSKRSGMSSRERSSSSETQAWAAPTILDPGATQPVGRTGSWSKVGSKEKKSEKRPSATRRSLRVRRNCPQEDTSALLKPQLSQEESVISLDSDSQDFPKEESPSLKVIQYLEIHSHLLLFGGPFNVAYYCV